MWMPSARPTVEGEEENRKMSKKEGDSVPAILSLSAEMLPDVMLVLRLSDDASEHCCVNRPSWRRNTRYLSANASSAARLEAARS